MYDHHLDDEQNCRMAAYKAEEEVPSGTPSPRTPRYPRILDNNGRVLSPNSTRVDPKATTQRRPLYSHIAARRYILHGCDDCRKGHHLARVKTTQVQALAQDCKTDVYFNTLSLLFPLIGHKTNVWWLDPVGATILSLFIIYDWAGTCIENVTRLTGEAADDRTTRKLMFMAWRFSPLVGGYKMMKAYHAGDGVWVEVDILMDEKTPLREAHDVAETLQYCMESLKEVDRAFVTMDCKSTVMNIADDDTNEGQILRKDRQDTRRIMSEGKVFVLYCVRLRCFVFGLHCFRFRLHGYGSPWIWIW
jgi:hypothetical protein